jgi:hypothetical protein
LGLLKNLFLELVLVVLELLLRLHYPPLHMKPGLIRQLVDKHVS